MHSLDHGVIIEFSRMGAYIKVSAFHEASMTEVSIVGDPKETEQKLKQTVLKKLNYVLNKENNKKLDQNAPKKDRRGGIIV
ncbi:hypothetical protein WH96_17790 [Kiloniella spongiae]|uniref:DUF6898 domain-containing protein n=1 Tax=Kiloniella spongiae TaxID=1489064 RepID=A0A0H2MAI2_9PROT|nr:hypothetical protein [Kiloniella spongiae]KLN59353.1 hypothetical protein WH96_17790 [Kiloniella spongiae]